MSSRHRFSVELLESRITPVTFGAPYGYDAGFNAGNVAVGDVDNDGDQDIVVKDAVVGTQIKLNDGTGQFTQFTTVGISDLRSVEVVDIDVDGNPDLVAASGSNFSVSIARGNGDGTFQAPFLVGSIGGALSSKVADFNTDGRPDVAVFSGGYVFVLFNNGSPTVLGTPAVGYNTGTDTYGGTVGDFNGDGAPDLVLSGYSTNRVDVLLNNGDGTFGPKASYPLAWHGGGVAAGDLDGDGRDDLVASLRGASGLYVYLSNPDGTLAPPVVYTPPRGSPDDAKLADFDGDGDLDVVSRSFGINRAIIWTNNGDGTLAPSVEVGVGFAPSDLAVGDLNGDTLPDIVVSQALSPASVLISLNTTPVNPPPIITSDGGGDAASIGVAENTTAVTTVTATDASVPAQTLTYSLGGPDAARFTIDASGALTFVTAPNFENPTDADGDNVYNVTVTVSDGTLTDTQALAVTVTDANEAATIDSLTGPVAGTPTTAVPGGTPVTFTGVRGQPLAFATTFSDVDAIDTHEVQWDFGDGTVSAWLPVTGHAASAPAHAYAASGTYTLTVKVRDDDGGEVSFSQQVEVKAIELQAAPSDPAKTVLVVGGTTGADQIAMSGNGAMTVSINGAALGTFGPTDGVAVYGQGGDDHIPISGSVETVFVDSGSGADVVQVSGLYQTVAVLAGDGNDTVQTSGTVTRAVLVGGGGDDTLRGSSGHDILIGGDGADQLLGGGGSDLLIAGYTAYDDLDALSALHGVWLDPARTYAEKVAALQSPATLPFGVRLAPDTVFDDGATDVLTGGAAQDWFLFDPLLDDPTDVASNETVGFMPPA